MTLRASMLVPLIYDAPNLRRVTYIVSTAFVSLYTSCSCPLPERRETRDRPRDLMACTAALVLLPGLVRGIGGLRPENERHGVGSNSTENFLFSKFHEIIE